MAAVARAVLGAHAGGIRPTPDEDGCIYVLAHTVALDLTASCAATGAMATCGDAARPTRQVSPARPREGVGCADAATGLPHEEHTHEPSHGQPTHHPCRDRRGGAIIAVAGASSAAPAGDRASVLRADLAPYTAPHAGAVVDSGITGRAMLVTPAGSTGTTARIEAAGLEAGHSYGVHVHFGSCLEFRGHFQFQFPGPVTRANEVWLDLTANRAGQRATRSRSRR